MTYKHCSPCDSFDICLCCEKVICTDCYENYDSEHMILNDEAHEKLVSLEKNEMLMPAGLCRECLFYAHHNPNDPEQEEYDENLVYEVKYEDVEVKKPFRGKCIETKKRIIIVGKKPKRTVETRKGPFYFPAEVSHD